jgi:two-component system KDP operon response regulator KdpE
MTETNPVVLVVDDEVQIRRFLRAGLELDGFSVQDAEMGADALRWATLKAPDLVILDLGLPDMDGAEVLERLRAWSTVPLIVLSVRSDEAEKVRLLESFWCGRTPPSGGTCASPPASRWSRSDRSRSTLPHGS